MSREHDGGPSVIIRPLRTCPGCGSRRLDPVVEAAVDEVHFRCRDCGRCWDIELNAVRRVPPTSCFGCPERGRCIEIYAHDHPER